MPRYLNFTLAAPMASFGTVAVGGRRTGLDRPAKSQVLGLVAAALGIERLREHEHASLAASLHYAVRVEAPGIGETDYHTAQIPPTTRRRRYATRADELAVPKHELETELSWREFRTGVHATACLWHCKTADAEVRPEISLDEIAEKLAHPGFALFLGRKAHPLMLPCRPLIVEAATVAAALVARDRIAEDALSAFHERFGTNPLATPAMRALPPAVVYADQLTEAELGLRIERRETTRDVPECRAKWRFDVRTEVVAQWRPAT